MAKEDRLKVPPHNLDAEKSILGAILLDDEALLNVADIISPADFYHPRHATIFQMMLELFEKQSPIDVLTLTNQLKSKKHFAEVGGAAAISELVEETPTAAHSEEYAKIVKGLSIRRHLIDLGAKMNELAFKEDE